MRTGHDNQASTTSPPAAGRCPVTGRTGPEPVDPGPKGWPVVGYTVRFLRDPLVAMLRVQRDHGDIAWLRLLIRPAIQVTSPKAAKRILQSNHANYRRGKWHVGLREWMGMGLITLDGEEWRRHRRVLQPAFTAKGLARQFDDVVYGVDRQIARWDRLASTGEAVDLVQEANELVSRAFSRSLMGRDLDRELIRAVAIASESVYRRTVGQELVPRFVPTRYNRRKRWAHRKLDAVADEIARSRSAHDERDDVAGLLLRSDLGATAFRHNLRTILLAGSDTTAMGLAWALWELALHPAIRAEVEQEVDEVLGGRTPTGADVERLPICRAVVDETLRLHPPIWVMPRDANGDDEVDGRPIRKDESVVIPFSALHRSPEHWPDPASFDHRRFLHEPEAVRRNGAYLPFGAGKHLCIGRELALTTLVVGVAMLSRRFRVEVEGADNVRQKAHTTIQPDPGMRVTVRERPRRAEAGSGATPATGAPA